MATKDEIRTFVRDGFAARHQNAPAAPGDEAVVTLAYGLLRRLVDPTGGTLSVLASAVFGAPSVPAQVARTVVDYYLDGLRNNPPFPQLPQIEPLLRSWFVHLTGTAPQPAELGVLVNVEVGILLAKFLNGPPQAKMELASVLGSAYLEGGAA